MVVVSSVPGVSEKEKRDLVRRVLDSSTLSSPALQAFFHFITDHAIAGDLDAIKEQRIGCEALGRRPDYDPATDNIVRVRAHELRSKLAKYFETEGTDEPITITIPKGSYIPVFALRQHKTPTTAPVLQTIMPAPAAMLKRRWVPWVLAGILFIGLVLRFQFPPQTMTAASAGSAPPAAINDLWAQFFHEGDHTVTIVSADSSFALWQDVTGKRVNLGDYITRKFVPMSGGDLKLSEIASRLCTSPADLSVALEIDEVSRAFHGHLRHRYARDINPPELRTGNIVLMGSSRSNPWVEVFESHMNFVTDHNAAAPHFHNKTPEPGEPADFSIPSRFDSDGAEKQQMVSYAVAALVPNLSGSGFVLILEGLNMEGTAAVGDVVTNPGKLAVLLERLGHKRGTPVKPFEALTKLTSIPGGFAYPEVIAVRSIAQTR